MTHYSETHRPYWNPLKAMHRETVDSYTDRVLPANQDTLMHQQHLIRLALKETEGTAEETWTRVISEKSGLQSGHFSRAAATGLHHGEDSHCSPCTDDFGQRWLCTNCSHGIAAHQYPHLDNIICRHHSKWVGPGSGPEEQMHVGADHQEAERRFRQLRRRGQMDAHFYVTLRRAFRTHQTSKAETTDNMTLTDILIYPLMMAVATALTRVDFLQNLFDPTRTYAASYETLEQQVRSAVGPGFTDVTRELWLYLRPTFLSVREHSLGKRAYVRTWDHDFPVPTAIINTLQPLTTAPEPFRNYLDVTGAYILTEKNWAAVRVHHLNERKHPGSKRRADDDFASICRSGHRITLTVSHFNKFLGPTSDGCRICSNHLVEPGFNDLETRYPARAREFHPEDNDGILPSQILPSSTTPYNWRCPQAGHLITTSPTNRVNGDPGCRVCLNREFRPGVNDIRTRCPQLATEWHPKLNVRRPEEVAVGSPDSAWWQCRFNHVWEALIESRVHGHGCPKCSARKLHGTNLPAARPDIAQEWDLDANMPVKPEDVAPHSCDTYAWRCPKDHPYRQRVDRRTSGSGCPYCARRKPLPGETDVASEHPLLIIDWDTERNGDIQPDQILPGTAKHWWKCFQNHEELQSVPHRVKSNGCTHCPADLRAGASPNLPARH